MRGRKPKPTALKKLSGNPGKRPLGSELTPDRRKMYAPRFLNERAKKVWSRLFPELYVLGLVTVLDFDSLAILVQAVADYVEARDHLEEEGRILKSPNGYPIINPWASVANRAAEQIRQYGSDFGLNPSSRSRLTGSYNDQKEKSLAEVLFEMSSGSVEKKE